MAHRYFEKFPQITYANNKVVDITERVVITDRTLDNPYVFYPYDISVYERPDQFANRYYNDPHYAWLLYLSNKITDPYYGWYLTEDDFQKFLVKKYAILGWADYEVLDYIQRKVKYYRFNHHNRDPITPAMYTALSVTQQKYWEPVYAGDGRILQYKTISKDISLVTNNIRVYNVSNSNNFNHDEICTVFFDYQRYANGMIVPGSQPYSGQGQVIYKTPGKLYLQHTSGYTVANRLSLTANTTGFSALYNYLYLEDADKFFSQDDEVYYQVPSGNTAIAGLTGNTNYLVSFVNSSVIILTDMNGSELNITDNRTTNPGERHYLMLEQDRRDANTVSINATSSYIYGQESKANTLFTAAISFANNIPAEEIVYYEPVTYYDYEREKNEYNKTILVLDKDFAEEVSNKLTDLLE